MTPYEIAVANAALDIQLEEEKKAAKKKHP